MAGQKCSVCGHPARPVIDKLIASGAASSRAISRQYNLSKDAVRRHGEHIARAVRVQAQRRIERHEEAVADGFEQRLATAHAAVQRALERAEEDPEGVRYIAPLVAQLHRGAELIGRATGRLDGDSRRAGDVTLQFAIVMPRPSATTSDCITASTLPSPEPEED